MLAWVMNLGFAASGTADTPSTGGPSTRYGIPTRRRYPPEILWII